MGLKYFVVCENFAGTGVEKKARAQSRALRELYDYRPVLYSSRSPLKRIFTDQFDAVSKMIKGEKVYYRYAALNHIINGYLISHMKGRYILEINTKNTEELKREEGLKGKLKRYLNNKYEKRLYDNAGHIITFTEELKAYINSISPHAPVTVIDNGYERPAVIPEEDPGLNERIDSLRAKGFMITVMAATFFPWTGVDRVIDIINASERLALVLAGFGPEQNSILKQLAASKSGRVIFTGRKTAAQLAAVYEKCDAAFASMALDRIAIHEARPLKAREYLAYGLPVICGYKESPLLAASPYLLTYDGNVKDIESFVENAAASAKADIIKPQDWTDIFKNLKAGNIL